MISHSTALAFVLALASFAWEGARAQQSSQSPGMAQDILLLRDGAQKRGPLSECGRVNCRIGAELVPRATIAWIGLARDTITPPPVRDPARDEIHLVNGTVQTGELTGIDSTQVHTATVSASFSITSRLRRERVAWIHLGGVVRAEDRIPKPAEPKREETKHDDAKHDEKPATGLAETWRAPPRIFIFNPRQCPTCLAHLTVLDLVTRDGAVFLSKSRAIEISHNLVSGSWFSYDPPPRLFPGTIATKVFWQDSPDRTRARTWVTEHHYLENRGRGGSAASGGGRSPSASAGPLPAPRERATNPIDQKVGDAVDRTKESIEDWARERIAQDHAAEHVRNNNRTGASHAGGRGARQYSERTGLSDYTYVLRMQNWQIVADEYVRNHSPNWERYRRLKDIPLYDVELDLRFNWRDSIIRSRRVDPDGYTTDTVSGQTRQRGPARPAQDVYAPSPPAAKTGPTDPLDHMLGDPIARFRKRAEEWARERLSEFAPSSGPSASGAFDRATPVSGGPGHNVHLAMRWFRAEGRVTRYYATDVIKNVLDGESGFGYMPGYIVSTTPPGGAFDIETPPSWPAPNPKPPPRVPDFNFRP